jgi:hypothetical protein
MTTPSENRPEQQNTGPDDTDQDAEPSLNAPGDAGPTGHVPDEDQDEE